MGYGDYIKWRHFEACDHNRRNYIWARRSARYVCVGLDTTIKRANKNFGGKEQTKSPEMEPSFWNGSELECWYAHSDNVWWRCWWGSWVWFGFYSDVGTYERRSSWLDNWSDERWSMYVKAPFQKLMETEKSSTSSSWKTCHLTTVRKANHQTSSVRWITFTNN